MKVLHRCKDDLQSCKGFENIAPGGLPGPTILTRRKGNSSKCKSSDMNEYKCIQNIWMVHDIDLLGIA